MTSRNHIRFLFLTELTLRDHNLCTELLILAYQKEKSMHKLLIYGMVGNEGFDRSSGRDPPLLTIDICHTRHISSIVRILIPQILRISPLKNPLFFKSGFYVTNGWEWGIRTPDGGFRVPCLTTWRIPSMNIARWIVSKGGYFANLLFLILYIHNIFAKNKKFPTIVVIIFIYKQICNSSLDSSSSYSE